ncbi:MAG: biliverdin-producing heme oxygenase [Pseudomonadota bacterium]|nr:biliverdin-producing heme oxygenase [Pseudomonadota bacterium]
MPIEDSPASRLGASSTNRRNSLRGATDHLHRDLDRIAAGFNLADVTHYRRFLQANAATLIAVEQLLETAGVAELLTDWPQRTRRAAILADLHSLETEVQPLALRRTVPTSAEVFGILYVLEGSRLGARVQLDQVLASADEQVRKSSSYLSSDSGLWRSFLEQLETHEAADDQTQTVSGAVYAFTMFIRSFSQAASDLHLRSAPAA